MKIQLLDCTLRDGGYLNNWEFEKNSILSIFNRLSNANLDIIEVGFLDERVPFNTNRTINPQTSNFDEIFDSIKEKKAMVVAMIDYGTCSINNIKQPKFIDGIRVIFKKKDIDGAIDFCKKIKDKGYKVFVQPVSITSYSDVEMLQLIEKVNELMPYAMSMVDTYGLMHKNNMFKYFYLMDNNLHKDIKIGYHSHNNFQLAYSNTIEFIELKTKHDIIADGTLFGMGKSAGNSCTELLAMYLNDNFNKNYILSEILEIIDTDILKYKKQVEWGYQLLHFVSALNNSHPMYVQYLQSKNTLSITSINEILQKIPTEKKLSFDKNLISELYHNYQLNEIDDIQTSNILFKELHNRTILLLGPGNSVLKQKNDILNFVKENDPIIFSVNHISTVVAPDYVFISNTKRYEQYVNIFINENNDFKIIATSNIKSIFGEFDYILNYGNLVNNNDYISDNSLCMLLSSLKNMNISDVALAGFDGFDVSDNNFYNKFLSLSQNSDNIELINNAISEQLKEFEQVMNIKYITDTKY